MPFGFLNLLEFVPVNSWGDREESLGTRVPHLADFLGIEGHSAATPLAGRSVVVGVPDERGVALNRGFPGAARGPLSFKNAFYKLYDTPLAEGAHGQRKGMGAKFGKVTPRRLLSSVVVDGGMLRLTEDIASTHEALAQVVEGCLKLGAEVVFVIGGGHDFSYGSYLGHTRHTAGILPIVNLDAHFDLRPVVDGSLNSGTPFRRAIENLPVATAQGKALMELGIQRERNPNSLYEFALETGVCVVEYLTLLKLWRNVGTGHERTPLDFLYEFLEHCHTLGWARSPNTLHLSLDLDVFSAHQAPGTSASTLLGPSLDELAPVLVYLAKTKSVRVFDVAELCPPRDSNEQTARLAASLVYRHLLLREEYGLR